MQTLRNATFLARLVLAWFALSIGVAVAAPVVKPVSLEVICAGGAMKLMVKGDDGQPAGGATLDCPMCGSHAAPPPSIPLAALPQPLAHAVQPIPAARIAAITAAPLPARGPPVSVFA